MPYTTPVYNRTLTDVQTRTSKGLFNVADWNRIYGNTQYVSNDLLTLVGLIVIAPTIATPTTSSIPQVADFNSVLACIEAMRVQMTTYYAAVISAITTLTYIAGAGEKAPDYLAVNQWEYCLDQIKVLVESFAALAEKVICGVATCGGDVIMDSI